MSQPESTERCEVCGREFVGIACWKPDCYRLGYERVSRALAEAEKELAVWRNEDAREAKYEWVSKQAREAKYEWVSKQARAAEERAAQAERVLRIARDFVTTGWGYKGQFDALLAAIDRVLSGESTTRTPQPTALQEAAKGRAPEAPPMHANGCGSFRELECDCAAGAQGEEK